MAVIQISKIQVRRGRENETGVPQLASGEFGWAVDTQNLYIGSGSVAEGAPSVDNIKILTEKDNILLFAETYAYRRNDPYVLTGDTGTTERSLQDRLDEQVSIYSFGAVDSGSDDQTEVIQRAIDQLYLNFATKGEENSRVKLLFGPGVYKISSPLRIPPYAYLVGSGKDSTIIQQEGNFPVAITVSDDSDPGSYTDLNDITSTNYPRYIVIENMHLKNTTANSGLVLDAAQHVVIDNCKLSGSWTHGDGSSLFEDSAIVLNAVSTLVTCSDIQITNCELMNFGFGIESSYDINNVHIKNSRFNNLHKGIVFGQNSDGTSPGQQQGGFYCVFADNFFTDIDREAVLIIKGRYNRSTGNTFVRVGYDGGNPETVVSPIIYFEDYENSSINDVFERTRDLGTGSSYDSYPYLPEVKGKGYSVFNNSIVITPGHNPTSAKIFRIPGIETAQYKLRYLYNSANAEVVRKGELDLLIDRTNSPATVNLIENYDVYGNSTNFTNLSFSAHLVDSGDSDTNTDTVEIRAQNTTAFDQGTLVFFFDKLS